MRKVLLDHCVPRPFERLLPGHEARHTSRLGWGGLSNGRLLAAAEEAGFEVLLTIDQNLRYEQNMSGRRIAVLLLKSPRNDIPTLTPMAGSVLLALEDIEPGTIHAVEHPDPPRKGGG